MNKSSSTVPRRSKIYSRGEVESLIADGRAILVINNKVIKADAWLNYHPGGDLAIRHMIGRDATDEVNAYVRAGVAILRPTWLT